jgi:hypothetical protein
MKPHPLFSNREQTIYKKVTDTHNLWGVEALVIFKYGDNIIHEYHTEGGKWGAILEMIVGISSFLVSGYSRYL